MLWPDAERVHAQVVQGVALGDRANEQLVGRPMGELLCPASGHLHGEVAVAIPAHRAAPKPAAIRLRELRLEAFSDVPWLRTHRHGVNDTTSDTEWIGAQFMAALDHQPMGESA